MASALEGCWAKIQRAHHHAEELRAEILRVPEAAKFVRFRQEHDQPSGTITLVVSSVPETPTEWTLLAADALQNLRTALNYLAWELARWNLGRLGVERRPIAQTAFPIANAPEKFNRSMVADLRADHAASVEACQPYDDDYLRSVHPGISNATRSKVPGGWQHAVDQHPLTMLRELTNRDKHQLLQMVTVGASAFATGPGFGPPDVFHDCEPGSVSMFHVGALTPGVRVRTYEVVATGPSPRVEVRNGMFSTAASFEDGRLVEDTLAMIENAVVQVVSRFDPVFR